MPIYKKRYKKRYETVVGLPYNFTHGANEPARQKRNNELKQLSARKAAAKAAEAAATEAEVEAAAETAETEAQAQATAVAEAASLQGASLQGASAEKAAATAEAAAAATGTEEEVAQAQAVAAATEAAAVAQEKAVAAAVAAARAEAAVAQEKAVAEAVAAARAEKLKRVISLIIQFGKVNDTRIKLTNTQKLLEYFQNEIRRPIKKVRVGSRTKQIDQTEESQVKLGETLVQEKLLREYLQKLNRLLESRVKETKQNNEHLIKQIEEIKIQERLVFNEKIEETEILKIWIESENPHEYIGYLKDDKMKVLLLMRGMKQCTFTFSKTNNIGADDKFEQKNILRFNIHKGNQYHKKMAEACVNYLFPRYTKLSENCYVVDGKLYRIDKSIQEQEKLLREHTDYNLLSKHINMYKQLLQENTIPRIKKIEINTYGLVYILTINTNVYYGYKGEPTENYKTQPTDKLMMVIKEIMENPNKKIELLNDNFDLFNVNSLLDLSQFIECFEK